MQLSHTWNSQNVFIVNRRTHVKGFYCILRGKLVVLSTVEELKLSTDHLKASQTLSGNTHHCYVKKKHRFMLDEDTCDLSISSSSANIEEKPPDDLDVTSSILPQQAPNHCLQFTVVTIRCNLIKSKLYHNSYLNQKIYSIYCYIYIYCIFKEV